MSIKANHDPKIWCDICKIRWGKNKDGWHEKAMRPARWIVVSETMERKGVTRTYCQPCANEVQTLADGSHWSFRDQLNYALEKEYLHGMESR